MPGRHHAPWNPLRYLAAFMAYPGWLEVLAGMGGGVGYTLVMIISGVGVNERPSLQIATHFLTPAVWEVMGVLLASWHAWALFRFRRRMRAWAMAASSAFWCNIVFGILAKQIITGDPIAVLAVPGCIFCLICTVLTWRLWKGYA